MQPERFHLIAAVFIILVKDNTIFLAKRINTGWEDGKYSLVGGHMDGNETARQAAVREAKEETGVIIQPEDLTFVNVSHLITNSERIHFTFVASKWVGEPTIAEVDKADAAAWFPLDALPENIMDVSQKTIDWYKNDTPYSEYGWNKE